jgi:hypothetical protein
MYGIVDLQNITARTLEFVIYIRALISSRMKDSTPAYAINIKVGMVGSI